MQQGPSTKHNFRRSGKTGSEKSGRGCHKLDAAWHRSQPLAYERSLSGLCDSRLLRKFRGGQVVCMVWSGWPRRFPKSRFWRAIIDIAGKFTWLPMLLDHQQECSGQVVAHPEPARLKRAKHTTTKVRTHLSLQKDAQVRRDVCRTGRVFVADLGRATPSICSSLSFRRGRGRPNSLARKRSATSPAEPPLDPERSSTQAEGGISPARH